MSPTGSDTNAGTQAAPFLTIQHAHGAITAGGTIWVMAGTYRYDRTVNLSLAGSANNLTRLWAVPGGARPIIDLRSLIWARSASDARPVLDHALTQFRVGVVQSAQSDSFPAALADIFMTPGTLPVFFRNFSMLSFSGCDHSGLREQ